MQHIPEPIQRISNKTATVWRINSLISNGIFLIVLGVALFLSQYFDWVDWINTIIYILIGLTVLHLIYRLTIYPIYMQRTWRYEINEDFVQIKHGFINHYHAIVPMSRVEYVNTDQGPILRRFALASLTVGTLTSSHEIPALSVEEAAEIREKIVYFAKIVDVVEDEEPVQGMVERSNESIEHVEQKVDDHE